MEIAYPNSNRIGRFRLLYETLRADAAMCGALFALCSPSLEHPSSAILAVEDHESGRGKEYIAASPLFDELLDGEEIPEYRIEFAYDRPFDNPEWETRRIESGKFRFAAFRQIVVRVPPLAIGARPQTGRLH
jgi:hypothetical protein